MKFLNNILYVLIFLLNLSCDDLVYVTGTFCNRLNSPNNISGSFVVVVRNAKGDLIPNFQIYIIKLSDSSSVTGCKFSEQEKSVLFNFPDEQIDGISPDEKNLAIIAYHPQVGLLSRNINITDISNGKLLVVEIDAGDISSALSKAPLYQYLEFRNY